MGRLHILLSLIISLFCFSASAQNSVTIITQVVDGYPALSPDGKHIVFTSNRSGTYQIYTCNTEGENIKQLTHSSGSNATPVWSPDGDQIVFASERDNDSEIYIMNADGTEQTRLTNQPGDDSHPKFSPDGSKIIFNSPRSTPDLSVPWLEQFHEIYTMDREGNNLKQITSFKSVCTYPSYSPDGKKIAFRRITEDPGLDWALDSIDINSEIFVMDSDGTNPANVSNSEAYDGWPCWMPDSKTILFTSNRGGIAFRGQLYRVKTDGSGLKRLTNLDDSYVQASLSQDGKIIYAQRNRETETYEYGHIVAIEIE
jgi:Tol biopolymer transport system component